MSVQITNIHGYDFKLRKNYLLIRTSIFALPRMSIIRNVKRIHVHQYHPSLNEPGPYVPIQAIALYSREGASKWRRNQHLGGTPNTIPFQYNLANPETRIYEISSKWQSISFDRSPGQVSNQHTASLVSQHIETAVPDVASHIASFLTPHVHGDASTIRKSATLGGKSKKRNDRRRRRRRRHTKKRK